MTQNSAPKPNRNRRRAGTQGAAPVLEHLAATQPATPEVVWRPALERHNIAVYLLLLGLAIFGLFASVDDRRGDSGWGVWPTLLSATLYAAWMMFDASTLKNSGSDVWSRVRFATLLAPFAISVPVSVVYAIVHQTHDLDAVRDRHYWFGEPMGQTILLMNLAGWLCGALAALVVGAVIVAPRRMWLRRQRERGADVVVADAAASASGVAPARPATTQPASWRDEWRSVRTPLNLTVGLALFALMGVATFHTTQDPYSPWAMLAFPAPVMLYSMWLVLQAIWVSADRVRVGRRTVVAMFFAPPIFLFGQLLLTMLFARLRRGVDAGQPVRWLLPFTLETAQLVLVGWFFAAALALGAWIVSGGVTAALRAWARRHPIWQSQHQLVRRATMMIGIGITPLVAGWALQHWVFRTLWGAGTWRMIRSMTRNLPPAYSTPLTLTWVMVIGLMVVGGALIVFGVLQAALAARQRYVEALQPTAVPVAVPTVEPEETASPELIPANFVEPAPGEQPHPDSPLAEYLATVQYDGGDPPEEPPAKRSRFSLRGRRQKHERADTLDE